MQHKISVIENVLVKGKRKVQISHYSFNSEDDMEGFIKLCKEDRSTVMVHKVRQTG